MVSSNELPNKKPETPEEKMEREKARLLGESDRGQGEIVAEVQDELGTSRVSQFSHPEQHPGHIDFFEDSRDDSEDEDPFAGIDGEGADGVKAMSAFEEFGSAEDPFDTVFENGEDTVTVDETQLVETETADLVEAQAEQQENAGRRVYKMAKNQNSGRLSDGTDLMGPEDGIERVA